MTLLIQHGHGKSDKIDRVVDAGHAAGVIYSPRNESPPNLVSYIEKLANDHSGIIQIIDPQFYASTVIGGNMGKLVEYEYFTPDLHFRNFRSATDISRHVRAVIDFQQETAVSHYCSPTISVDNFSDRWATIAVNMAAESIDYYSTMDDRRPLLISLVVHEQALRSHDQLDEFLDQITDLECEGFYVVLRHETPNFSQGIDPASLDGLLYLVHTLANLNGFQVYVGYSDFCAISLHGAGATATAAGWNNGSKQFSFGRFEPQGGGRQAKARYSSSHLLNSIPITPEFDFIARLQMANLVLSGTRYDAGFRTTTPSAISWDETTSALHHLEVLHNLISEVEMLSGPRRRLDHVQAMITRADALYTRLKAAGVQFEAAAGPAHLREWTDGIREFRTHAGI